MACADPIKSDAAWRRRANQRKTLPSCEQVVCIKTDKAASRVKGLLGEDESLTRYRLARGWVNSEEVG